MKLIDILKQQGLFANDIRTRFKNDQILVNGMPVKSDFTVSDHTINAVDEFIFSLCANPKWALQLQFIGIDNIFDCNIETDLKKEFEKNLFVRTSKKHSFIITLNENFKN